MNKAEKEVLHRVHRHQGALRRWVKKTVTASFVQAVLKAFGVDGLKRGPLNRVKDQAEIRRLIEYDLLVFGEAHIVRRGKMVTVLDPMKVELSMRLDGPIPQVKRRRRGKNIPEMRGDSSTPDREEE